MKFAKRCLLLCLVICLAFALSGCRYSDTIEQIIYDQFMSGMVDIDPPFELNNNEEENEEETEDLQDKKEEETAERQNQPKKAGILAKNGKGKGSRVVYSKDGSSNLKVNSGQVEKADEDSSDQEDPSDDTGSNDEGEVTENTDPARDNAGETGDFGDEGKSDENGENGQGEGGDGNGESPEPSGKVHTYKKITDASGKSYQVPEGVETVAAVGEAAVMTAVIGAGESLVATDAATLSLSASCGDSVMADMSGAQSLWEGDGSSGIGSSALKDLLSLEPDLVVEISGSSALSDGDIKKLTDQGISCLTLPALDSISDISDGVSLLGQVYEGTDYDEAPGRAKAYVKFVKDLTKDVKNATGNSAKYTLYVDDWDYDAVCKISNENYTLKKSGAAVIRNKKYTETLLLSDALSSAKVTNTTTAKIAGVAESRKALYFSPLYCKISGSKLSIEGVITKGKFADANMLLEPAEGASLGTNKFPAVIAADESVAEGIRASREEDQGFWGVYEKVDNGSKTFNGDGFLDEKGNIILTQISGDYDILVNPYGFESWAQGSCESVLESAWAAWAISGEMGESEVRSYVKEFYKDFYDYSLSDSEISNILKN